MDKALVTLEKAMGYLGMGADDAAIPVELFDAYLNAASEMILRYLRRGIAYGDYEDARDGGGEALKLYAYPVEDVKSVTVNGVAVSGWILDDANGLLFCGRWGERWPETRQGIRVAYTAGYEPMPEVLQLATALLAQALMEANQASGQIIASERMDLYSVSYLSAQADRQGLDGLAPAVASMVWPYRSR